MHHRPPKKDLEREHNAATTVKFYAVARDRDAAGTLQYRRGLLQLSVPRSLVLQPDFAAGSVRDEAS